MFFRIAFTITIVLVAMFLLRTVLNAETLPEYCKRTEDPACVGGTPVNDAVWSDMLRDSQYMRRILGEDGTEEGEIFRPTDPVLLYRGESGTEHWDKCALSRKNLLLTYYGFPFNRLALAVMESHDGDQRTVLLFHSPHNKIEVVDCEKDRVLTFDQFLFEGNDLIAAESKVSEEWEVGTAYSE